MNEAPGAMPARQPAFISRRREDPVNAASMPTAVFGDPESALASWSAWTGIGEGHGKLP
jgi:hypothetical protein